MVVDGHLFRTHPHVLHQDEFDGGRHGHERLVLKGQGQPSDPGATGRPHAALAREEGDQSPRSWYHPRAFVMSGTQAAERPRPFGASHNPAKASAPPSLPAAHTLESRAHSKRPAVPVQGWALGRRQRANAPPRRPPGTPREQVWPSPRAMGIFKDLCFLPHVTPGRRRDLTQL